MIGETANLAARLQALADPGTVVIGLSTRRLVGGLFELADRGAKNLKGFGLHAAQSLGARAARPVIAMPSFTIAIETEFGHRSRDPALDRI